MNANIAALVKMLQGAAGKAGPMLQGVAGKAGSALKGMGAGLGQFAAKNPELAGFGAGAITAGVPGILGVGSLASLLENEEELAKYLAAKKGIRSPEMGEGQLMDLLNPLMGRDGGKIY